MKTEGSQTKAKVELEDLVTLYVDTLRTMIDALPQKHAGGDPAVGSEQEILLLLARAQTAWLTSGMRYWKQMAEILTRKGFGLTDLAAATTAAAEGNASELTMQRLLLIDKARACLREVAEASVSESHALRHKLMEIEQELRDSQSTGDAPVGKRNMRIKT